MSSFEEYSAYKSCHICMKKGYVQKETEWGKEMKEHVVIGTNMDSVDGVHCFAYRLRVAVWIEL